MAVVVLVVGVLRRTLRPVDRVGAALEAMARGDLTAVADVDQDDEVGKMARSLRSAQQSLRESAAEIAATAGAVAAASEEPPASSTQVAASSEESSVQAVSWPRRRSRSRRTCRRWPPVRSRWVPKELAQETAKATEDIARRVEAIQGDTTGAVDAIGQISEVIGRITDYQMTIASAVEEQTATTTEMSRGVAEVATGSGEIASNITGVASSAAANTEALAQMSTAVAELAQMAENLRSGVSQLTY